MKMLAVVEEEEKETKREGEEEEDHPQSVDSMFFRRVMRETHFITTLEGEDGQKGT